MSVDRKWLEQNGKKPTINAVPLAGSGYDRKEMLMRLYNKLDTMMYKVDKLQGYFTKDQVTHIIRKIQGLISDVIEERPIDEADFSTKGVDRMRILIKTASNYMDRYEYVLKDYNPTYFEDRWGDKKVIIEAESISDLKELSRKLKQDLIIANPYDEYSIPVGVQADLSITIYDDYIE